MKKTRQILFLAFLIVGALAFACGLGAAFSGCATTAAPPPVQYSPNQHPTPSAFPYEVTK